MDNIPFHKKYRRNLTRELVQAPKALRAVMLAEAKNTPEYEQALADHLFERLKPEIDRLSEEKKKSELERRPELEFNLDDLEDFKEKIIAIAKWIYSTLKDYDPYRGDMLCGEISDKLVGYLIEKGVPAKRVARTYKILDPNGNYNDNFGHVYARIENGKETILVDLTYLQWVSASERDKYDPVLILRYKDEEELRRLFEQTPIRKEGMIIPFYLGFNSPEARDFFKNIAYTVESEECARIDD